MKKNTSASDKRIFSPEGFLLADAVLAKTGPLPYLRSEVMVPGDPRKPFYLSKTKADLEKALPSFKGAPITMEHPDPFVDASNFKQEIIGAVVSDPIMDSHGNVRASVRIYDKEAIRKIQSGENQLSPGFDYVLGNVTEDHGEAKAMRVNHIALLEAGRGGDKVRILDHLPKNDEVSKMPENEQLTTLTNAFQSALDAAIGRSASTTADLGNVKNQVVQEVMVKMQPAIDSLQKIIENQEATRIAADAAKAQEENQKAVDAAVDKARLEERNRFAVFNEAMKASGGQVSYQDLAPLSTRDILIKSIGDAYPVTDDISDEILFGVLQGLTRARDSMAQSQPQGRQMAGVPSVNPWGNPVMMPHQYTHNQQPTGWIGQPPPGGPVLAPNQVVDAMNQQHQNLNGTNVDQGKYDTRFNSTFGGNR